MAKHGVTKWLFVLGVATLVAACEPPHPKSNASQAAPATAPAMAPATAKAQPHVEKLSVADKKPAPPCHCAPLRAYASSTPAPSHARAKPHGAAPAPRQTASYDVPDYDYHRGARDGAAVYRDNDQYGRHARSGGWTEARSDSYYEGDARYENSERMRIDSDNFYGGAGNGDRYGAGAAAGYGDAYGAYGGYYGNGVWVDAYGKRYQVTAPGAGYYGQAPAYARASEYNRLRPWRGYNTGSGLATGY